MNIRKIAWLVGVGLLLRGFGGVAMAEDNAVIKGKVIFGSDPKNPKFKRTVLDTGKDPNCKNGKKKIGSYDVVINKKTSPPTLRNVMVFVKEGLGDRTWPAPKTPLVLNQLGCEYSPHVFGIMADQTLTVRNSDTTNHNIHFLPKKNEEMNFTQVRRTGRLK